MSPRAGLDKTIIVNAAADLVNHEGIEALSLSRLAEQLHVQTPSLYNHIDGLRSLYRELALLSLRDLGARLANAAIGKSGPEAIVAFAQAYRNYIKSCPGLYMANLRASRTQTSPDTELQAAEERIVEIGMAVTASFGLNGEDALHAVRGLRSLVHGFATLETSGGFGLPLDCDESFRRLAQIFILGLQTWIP